MKIAMKCFDIILIYVYIFFCSIKYFYMSDLVSTDPVVDQPPVAPISTVNDIVTDFKSNDGDNKVVVSTGPVTDKPAIVDTIESIVVPKKRAPRKKKPVVEQI